MLVVAALYQFTDIIDCESFRSRLLSFMTAQDIKGTVIIAPEGINGTVAGSRAAIDNLKAFLQQDGRFNDLEYKESFTENYPFKRLLVRIKKEIVTLKMPDINPNEIKGEYVNAQTWNKLLDDKDVTVIDVRNDFEVEMGTFKNSINPKTKAFSDFPRFVKENLSPTVHKKIAMSCTGGIRCEKASAYMKKMGFKKVYHLKGGVLKYLKEIPKDQSAWAGTCFVFDERIALDHELKKASSNHGLACARRDELP